MSLKNKRVLITGANGGIGSAIAAACAKEGSYLFLHCRKRNEAMDVLAKEVGRYANGVRVIEADLGAGDAVETIHHAVVNNFPMLGALDVLINNAGVYCVEKNFAEASMDQWDMIMNINARIPFFLTQKFGPELSATNGAIINISSLSGHIPRSRSVDYAMSKAALDMMTRCVAKKYPNVRVNAIAPGYVDTRMVSERTRNKDPKPYIAQPKEVAECVMWLLSPETAHLTGHVFPFVGSYELTGLKMIHK